MGHPTIEANTCDMLFGQEKVPVYVGCALHSVQGAGWVVWILPAVGTSTPQPHALHVYF